MSDTVAAVLIIPFLTLLVVTLECSRIGCTRLTSLLKRDRTGHVTGIEV